MAKKKANHEFREWIVPMRYTLDGYATVDARDADEAIEKCEAGQGIFVDNDVIDWSVRGKARENL